MSPEFYKAADFFFFAFHTTLILFNCFGWMVSKLRLYNLVSLLLTAFSWFILGIWFGWGYCFCTDWHWQVRENLGYHDATNSYVDLLVRKLTGMDFPDSLVDSVTATVFFVSLIISVTMNIRDYRKRKQRR